MGLEPTTLSLGSGRGTAWISGFRSTLRISYRSTPLATAAAGWSLAHNWRAREGQIRALPTAARGASGLSSPSAP